MVAQRKYPEELRERAVKMVLEVREREGKALTFAEVHSLTEACKGRYRDVVPVMALAGLRWGELAGLQVGDRYRLLALACGCSVRCCPAAAAVRCTWTR